MPQGARTIASTQPAQGAAGASKIQVPTDRGELTAIAQLREELRDQLGTLTRMRQELTNQVAQAAAVGDAQAIRGIQERIRNLDARSASVEQQILQADDAVRTAVAQGIATPTADAVVGVPAVPAVAPAFDRPPDMIGEDVFIGSLMGMTLLFAFLGVLIHRRAWRRAEKQLTGAGTGGRADLQQLQQAVDVIAVEVERISEGQRFVSKLLNERLDAPALPVGNERVAVPVKAADSASRR